MSESAECVPPSELRAKGADELALFAKVMAWYLGATTPRIRAATANELAQHWKTIGWDIDEPLLVAEIGGHRLIFDYMKGAVMMIDELRPAEK